MHLFYTPAIQNSSFTLDEDESKHAIRVLRLLAGDIIYLMDGKGGLYECNITDANPKRCTVSIVKKEQTEKRKTSLHLAVAPTKNMDRMEWLVEKATEIGMDEISMLLSANSERAIIKTERLEKIAVSAIKQSLKTYLPLINEMIPFKKFVENHKAFSGKKCIAYCGEGDKKPLKNVIDSNSNALILIGPEGDFTKEEVAFAIQNGFETVSLGNSRLRTETAALVACHTFNLIQE